MKTFTKINLAFAAAVTLAATVLPSVNASAAQNMQAAASNGAPNSFAAQSTASLPTGGATSLPNDIAGDVVAQRLTDTLSPELRENFGLFIYVDKAERGPLAQHMYVFQKTDGGDLAMLYDWPVSTGRERIEHDVHGHVQYSGTPLGFFELDPSRLYVDHSSSQWDESMPYSMFFNWKPNGRTTGLAIHGTPDENIGALGSPASAGCVRLSIDDAHTLFDLIRTQFHAPTPKLAYLDGQTGVSSEGLLEHEPDGSLKKFDGYSVLVLVDNFGGEERISSL